MTRQLVVFVGRADSRWVRADPVHHLVDQLAVTSSVVPGTRRLVLHAELLEHSPRPDVPSVRRGPDPRESKPRDAPRDCRARRFHSETAAPPWASHEGEDARCEAPPETSTQAYDSSPESAERCSTALQRARLFRPRPRCSEECEDRRGRWSRRALAAGMQRRACAAGRSDRRRSVLDFGPLRARHERRGLALVVARVGRPPASKAMHA